MNRQLAEFLASDGRPEGTMIYPELHGFLFSVCACPEAIPPDEWLPLVFNNEAANYADEAESEAITAAVMALYSEIHEQVIADELALPQWCTVLEPPLENFGDEAPLAYWARGFLDGHEWLSEIWEACVSESADDELGPALLVLFFFADRELAETLCREAGLEEVTVGKMAEMAADNIPTAMSSYARIGRGIAVNMANS